MSLKQFKENNLIIKKLIKDYYPKLKSLDSKTIRNSRNPQNRTIKEIIGHMSDSATNNTHRVVYLQYQENPLIFPDYANLGNNDRWISIQNYNEENWDELLDLWKFNNLHFLHIVENVKSEKLENVWISALGSKISLKDMIIDYLRHFKLHLSQIEELIDQK